VTNASDPATGTATPSRRRRIQPHHVVYVLLLVVVVVCVGVLVKKSQGNGVNLDDGNIEALMPPPGSKIVHQDEIGIDLAPGFEALLTLNGVPIPEDELLIVPQLNLVTFKEGAGKETVLLQGQQNCLTATYWRSATGPNQSTTRTWCFSVY